MWCLCLSDGCPARRPVSNARRFVGAELPRIRDSEQRFAVYRIICEALRVLRETWADTESRLRVHHAPAADSHRRQRPAAVCRCGSGTQKTQDARAALSLGSARPLRVRLRRMAVVRPTELLRRAVRRSCRWLCQQSDGAGQGDIRARVAVVPRGTAASPRPWLEGASSGPSGGA